MPEKTRLVVRFQQGNAVGVVEEPIRTDGKRVPRNKWMVKIGVADKKLARSLPFPRADVLEVIRLLKEYLEGIGARPKTTARTPKRGGHRS
jgi:hypothetical protein